MPPSTWRVTAVTGANGAASVRSSLRAASSSAVTPGMTASDRALTGSLKRTRTRRAARFSRSWGATTSAMRPWRMMATRSAMASTSLMMWDEKKTVAPAARASASSR